ncbi:MAG: amidohydrolase family protein, partial [Chromatocurvus sp.]
IGLGRLRDLADMAGGDEIGINFLSYIGHNALRREVMGMEQRAPTPEELQAMQTLVKEAMDFGTAGLSTGLMYLPGRYAATEEIIELAKVTATYGGVYDSHTRDPVNALLASHRECLDIAAAAGVDAHPGHIKAVGEKNFGRGPELVAMIEARIAGGENITVDIYPYDGAAAAPVIHLLYPGRDAQGESLMARMQAASDMETEDPSTTEQLTVDLRQYWQDVADNEEALAQAKELTEEPADSQFSWINTVGYGSLRIVVSDNPAYEDRLVSELASELGLDPFELLRRIIAAEGDSAMVTLGAIQEADVRVILKRPWTMVSSDGQELEPKHPRGRGTFPRLLGRYVREWKVLTLEEAVYKITGLPASYLKLSDRGVLRVGAIADITVFDPNTIIDRATWAEPTLFADGVDYVFIKGQAALDNGVLKPQRHGRFIPFRNAANTGVTET